MTTKTTASLLFSLALLFGGAAWSAGSDGPGEPDLDAKIGQMIMVGLAGSSERDARVVSVRDQLNKGVIGGVVLYPENIGRPEGLRNLNAYLRNAKSSPVPFIAVDQEGGLVQR